jgi:hypothetical protein
MEMKTTKTVVQICLFLAAVCISTGIGILPAGRLQAQEAAGQAVLSHRAETFHYAKAATSPEPLQEDKKTKEAKAQAPVAADAEFFELADDWNLVNFEIARIERASGTVEMPDSLLNLRERSKAKAAKLQKWIKDHGVDGWRFDAAGKQFLPPVAAEPKKDEKPAEAKK